LLTGGVGGKGEGAKSYKGMKAWGVLYKPLTTLCSEQFLLKFKLNFDSGEQSNPQRELNTKIFKTPIEIVKQLRYKSRQNYKNELFSFNILSNFDDQ
jgi:hypothetical protein